MRRHFTLHLGGTNTGKTYAGFQRAREEARLRPLATPGSRASNPR